MRKVNTTIDHFNIAVPDPARAVRTVRSLGFVCGDLPTDRLQHFMFDNSYFEFCSNGNDVIFPKVGLAKKAHEEPEIGSILLNGRDAGEARKLFLDAGYEVTERYIANRWANHGKLQGQAAFDAFLIKDFAPYRTNRIFGFSVHLTPELIFPDERFIHTNHADEIESLVFVTDRVDDNAAEIEKLDEIAKNVAIPGYYIRFSRLIDPKEYKEEFGEDLKADDEIKGAAVVFAGGDREYVKVCADHAGLNSFYKEGRLYVDIREDTGLFFIFK